MSTEIDAIEDMIYEDIMYRYQYWNWYDCVMLDCLGQTLSREEYEPLYKAIDKAYGSKPD
jgi:hypothetical protein